MVIATAQPLNFEDKTMTPQQKAIKALKNIDLKAIKARQAAYEQSIQCIPTTDPWVPINLGTKAFKLEFSYSATQEVQRKLNLNIFAGEVTQSDLSDMPTLATLLVCGLHTHHPDITDEDVFKLITLKHRLYYTHCIQKAMEVTQPDFDQLENILGDIKELQTNLDDLEAGDTSAPLPEIVPSPISGEPVE